MTAPTPARVTVVDFRGEAFDMPASEVEFITGAIVRFYPPKPWLSPGRVVVSIGAIFDWCLDIARREVGGGRCCILVRDEIVGGFIPSDR